MKAWIRELLDRRDRGELHLVRPVERAWRPRRGRRPIKSGGVNREPTVEEVLALWDRKVDPGYYTRSAADIAMQRRRA